MRCLHEKKSLALLLTETNIRMNQSIKIIILCLLFSLSSFMPRAQNLYFPPLAGNTWDTLSATSLGWCTQYVDSLYDYLDQHNSKAFILLKDGKIVFEKYFDNFTVDSIWYWASAGKSLTAFVVGITQQESLLSIQDTTAHYLGQGWTIAPPAKEQLIRIRNQLTMTSGLDDGVPDNHCTVDTCLSYLADAGTRWAYHNAPYTLLDSVIENACGTTLNNYLTQKIKIPTGMSGLYVKVDFDNVFYSKPRSMARYGLLMLNKGKWGATPIMTDTVYYQQMIQSSQNLNPAYGYLWWLNGKSSYMVPGLQVQLPGSLCPSAPADMYAALGKNGQMLDIVPSENLVWIRMGDAPDAGTVPILMNDTIWQKLNQIRCAPNSVTQANADNTELQLFPNPASSVLMLQSATNICRFQLLDVWGKIVFASSPSQKQMKIETSTLAAGWYVAMIQTTSGSAVKKVRIVH